MQMYMNITPIPALGNVPFVTGWPPDEARWPPSIPAATTTTTCPARRAPRHTRALFPRTSIFFLRRDIHRDIYTG